MRTIIKMVLFLFVLFLVQGMGLGTELTEETFKINIHGYLSQGFLISNRNNFVLDSKKGTFHFNELGLNFTSQLTDRIHVGVQFAARDFGDKGNDKVVIDWAFADYNWRDWLGLRVGKMKLPLGFYSKTRDVDMLRTFILLPQSVYPENFRDTETSMKGIGLYGAFSTGSSAGNISYQVSVGTTEVNIDSSTVDFFESFSNFEITGCNVGWLFNGIILWETPIKGLRTGFSLTNVNLVCSGILTKNVVIPLNFPPYIMTLARKGDIFTVDCPKYRISVLSVEYTLSNLVLTAEYLERRLAMNINVVDRYKNDWLLTVKSYYISGSYRFSAHFEAGVNYSVYDTELDSKIVPLPVYPYSNYQKDLCTAVRFDLNSHWTFKMEGHMIKGAALCLPRYNLNEAGIPVFARKWALFGAKFTYTF